MITLDCGHEAEQVMVKCRDKATGTEKSLCYACAADSIRKDMRTEGKMGLFFSEAPGGHKVTTWDGTVISDRVHIVNKGWRDNFGGFRIAFRFLFEDSVWSGVGPGYGMYCNCRRTKLKSLRA